MGGAVTRSFQLQPMIQHGELLNIYAPGHPALHPATVDAYNRYTTDINRATYHTNRETLLDNRHRFYVRAMFDQREEL
jgi:hypothetical protein